jgi:hypothetical protein
MEMIEHRTFEQTVSVKLMEWEQTKRELEQLLEKTDPSYMESIHFRIEKLTAKYNAAISNLKELDRGEIGGTFRKSG